MNDGELYGTTFEAAGTMMVPWVETTSPFDKTYKVVVSMMTVMLVVGMVAIDNGTVGSGKLDGTTVTVTVAKVADKTVTGELIDENETVLGMLLNEITARLGNDETTT
jgi:hypothetical protein